MHKPFTYTSTCQSVSNFQTRTPVEVFNATCDLEESTGPGCDGIETKLIKLASHILIYPLTDLFKLSLHTFEIVII